MINSLGQFVRADLSNKRFGTVTTTTEFRKAPNGGTLWQYKCDCSNVDWAWAEVLKRSPNFTCKECRKKVIAAARTTHGLRNTDEYKIRIGIIDRCNNPLSANYANWGGRGIKVCQRWIESPEAFCKDMGPRPSKKHTIGRIDNNGNYEPGNCRWETHEQQANNKRTCKYITYQGETKTYSQWARIFGITKRTVRVWYISAKTPEQMFDGRKRIS